MKMVESQPSKLQNPGTIPAGRYTYRKEALCIFSLSYFEKYRFGRSNVELNDFLMIMI